jgi:hypothetical protein
LGKDENHPPGEKREEAVDSSLVRVMAGGTSNVLKVLFGSAFSSTGDRRARVGLKERLISSSEGKIRLTSGLSHVLRYRWMGKGGSGAEWASRVDLRP